jgi:class 3 adenylate cyclase
MSAIALAYGATIDKYIGDAMLLFFGDPVSKGVKEDAKVCIMMAIAMQRRMRSWSRIGGSGVWRGRSVFE